MLAWISRRFFLCVVFSLRRQCLRCCVLCFFFLVFLRSWFSCLLCREFLRCCFLCFSFCGRVLRFLYFLRRCFNRVSFFWICVGLLVFCVIFWCCSSFFSPSFYVSLVQPRSEFVPLRRGSLVDDVHGAYNNSGHVVCRD